MDEKTRILINPDRALRGRRSARRRRRHRPQDHRRHLRRRGAARRRRVLRQRSDKGRPVRLLHGALRREERRRRRPRGALPGPARLRDRRRRAGLGLIDTFGTGKVDDEKISELVRAHFKLTPRGIIETLDLRRPIYKKTAAFGHFGRTEPEFTWERTDKATRSARTPASDRPRCRSREALVTEVTADGGPRGRRCLFLAAMPPAPLQTPAADLAGSAESCAGAFHIHTTRSDGAGRPRCRRAPRPRAGLQFVIFTDHGDGARPPRPPEYLHGVLCVDAVEISTDGGHYVALGMRPVAVSAGRRRGRGRGGRRAGSAASASPPIPILAEARTAPGTTGRCRSTGSSG